MIDLDDIKKRHLDPERNRGRTYYEGHIELDLTALVNEVERLRELLLNAGWPREAEGGAELAAGAERAAVVAWLRAEAEAAAQTYTVQAGQWANRIDGLADDIERGEHRREEKEE